MDTSLEITFSLEPRVSAIMNWQTILHILIVTLYAWIIAMLDKKTQLVKIFKVIEIFDLFQ